MDAFGEEAVPVPAMREGVLLLGLVQFPQEPSQMRGTGTGCDSVCVRTEGVDDHRCCPPSLSRIKCRLSRGHRV